MQLYTQETHTRRRRDCSRVIPHGERAMRHSLAVVTLTSVHNALNSCKRVLSNKFVLHIDCSAPVVNPSTDVRLHKELCHQEQIWKKTEKYSIGQPARRYAQGRKQERSFRQGLGYFKAHPSIMYHYYFKIQSP